MFEKECIMKGAYCVRDNFDINLPRFISEYLGYIDNSFKKGTKLGEVKIYYGDTLLDLYSKTETNKINKNIAEIHIILVIFINNVDTCVRFC